MERNLFIGNHSTVGGVRAFLDRIDVLSTYLPLFRPIFNVTYQELTNQENQLMLFDALPKDYTDQMKKVNQVPLEMPLEELRSYALNIEETMVNKVKNSNSTETKNTSNSNNHNASQKNGKRNVKVKFKKGKKNSQGNHTSSIIYGQAKPICSFCGNIGHVENTFRAKERSMKVKEAKQYTKDKAQKWKKDKLEKNKSFATATSKAASASASKNNDYDDDKFDNHDFMNAIIKSYDKSQKKAVENVVIVIMILVILIPTITTITNL
jgi:hypothetical protein